MIWHYNMIPSGFGLAQIGCKARKP